ncbi:DUF512 domain-containing protein [Clostridium fermenticellae]|uniref:DUF512 domain-containing protein n=1 Tax=Clostridium fermenticellae TaxID=2068654 RepID=A0A386H2X0_9CLOT|nr:DUF512 domain-containing protein [Clostridium fermenticellae]AYD40004.1 DUF512 domain-containing protein [Clostridium fermenticellae]
MKNEIISIKPESIAEELGIEIGDFLISINDKEVKDIIDYKFLICDEYVDVEIQKKDGELWELEIEKEYDEDLGVEFKDPIMDRPMSCHNKCIFCFIDQLPKGMRETLYFKDDDSRLAFLQGNFVTLTNMSEDDIDRIIKYKISPINISVHTTNPELRIKMTNNRFAGNVYKRMKKMAQFGIKMNCQVVLCPGINDGYELRKTIEDLFILYPSIINLAVVPVGTTKFRDGLYPLKLYNKDSASKQISMVEKIQKKYIKEVGVPFVRLSDEFYVLAERDVPDKEFYGQFEQLEDGIGMIRIFRDYIDSSLDKIREPLSGSFTMVTGVSAYKEILSAANRIKFINDKIDIKVEKIVNNFFGKNITVAGLLTATDIIDQLKNKKIGKYVIIPDNMLRRGYELSHDNNKVFLDDMTVEDLSRALNREILICNFTGEDLVDIVIEHCEEE